MNHILEFILIVFYLLLFLYAIKKHSFFIKSGIKPTWLSALFLLKIGVGLVLYFIYTRFYTVRAEADMFKYFDDSKVVYDALWLNPKDYFRLVFTTPPNTEYFNSHYYNVMNFWANKHHSFLYGDSQLMIKINAFFRLFSFGSFHVHALFFTFLSFVGLVGIYRVSKQLFTSHFNYLILVVFCLPSVLFWSSSVLKESLLLFFIGLLVLVLQKVRDIKLQDIIIALIALFFLLLLKFYVVLALIPPLISYVLVSKYKKLNVFKAYVLTLSIFVLFVFSSNFLFKPNLVDILVMKQTDFINISTQAGSYYEIGRLEPTFFSVVKNVPLGILNSFIRPLPSSSISIMAIPAIVENVFVLVALFLSFFSIINPLSWKDRKKNNWLLFQISFVLILFAIIGVTTPVAGALVRYKVAALPFLGVTLYYFFYKRYLQ